MERLTRAQPIHKLDSGSLPCVVQPERRQSHRDSETCNLIITVPAPSGRDAPNTRDCGRDQGRGAQAAAQGGGWSEGARRQWVSLSDWWQHDLDDSWSDSWSDWWGHDPVDSWGDWWGHDHGDSWSDWWSRSWRQWWLIVDAVSRAESLGDGHSRMLWEEPNLGGLPPRWRCGQARRVISPAAWTKPARGRVGK